MKNNNPVTIKELVEYGLDEVSSDQTIEVNLRDFMYVYRVLEEYMRFFHNPDHYPAIVDVKEFLGTISSAGGFEVLDTAVYKKMYKVELPEEVRKLIDDSILEHPSFPKYYNID